MAFHTPEKYRDHGSRHFGVGHRKGDPFGIFVVPPIAGRILPLRIIATDGGYGSVPASQGGGWEHVSVSTPVRTPNWEEMCLVKDLFWDPEDCVVQFHPPKSEYVNEAPYVLHLWRYALGDFPRPPTITVGRR